ncbi:MAG: YlmH/Sll1252 family protein [Clostridium sp.]|nr:YlmH/Sll1252 family protein [Clostridium sp.]
MKKSEFLNMFKNEDKLLLSNIYEKLNIAAKTGKTIYTSEFYTPDIWKNVARVGNSFGINVYSSGVFKNCERKMLAFSNEELYYFPIKIIKISNLSKFTNLEHRDYMGGIMSLGISRNKLGDIVLADNCCYVAVSEDIFQFVTDNLTLIGKCHVRITEVGIGEKEIPEIKFEVKNLIVSSLRLDCLVSGICNISRSKSLSLIHDGSVKVDYINTKEKDFLVDYDSTITIGGYGKYKLTGDNGVTNKKRLKLLLKKFI